MRTQILTSTITIILLAISSSSCKTNDPQAYSVDSTANNSASIELTVEEEQEIEKNIKRLEKEGYCWGCDLRGANLRYFTWERVNLAGSDLRGADLTGVILDYADLRGADLTGAKLIYASLWNSKLTDAILTKADLTEANLKGANLTRAKLIDADLTRAKLIDADLTGAVLTDANLTRADLKGTKIALETLQTADYKGALVYDMDTQ